MKSTPLENLENNIKDFTLSEKYKQPFESESYLCEIYGNYDHHNHNNR